MENLEICYFEGIEVKITDTGAKEATLYLAPENIDSSSLEKVKKGSFASVDITLPPYEPHKPPPEQVNAGSSAKAGSTPSASNATPVQPPTPPPPGLTHQNPKTLIFQRFAAKKLTFPILKGY